MIKWGRRIVHFGYVLPSFGISILMPQVRRKVAIAPKYIADLYKYPYLVYHDWFELHRERIISSSN